MFLQLMFITNKPQVALIAEKYGVDRIWVDLEVLGKEERQKNLDSVKSFHTVEDVKVLSKILKKSELMVRVNPLNKNSKEEIESVIQAGAKRIMLPMWKTESEVDEFLKLVNKRVKTTLLLETKEALECVDSVLENPLIDEIHIGLNDLHLSYGLTFMFELLSNGVVEMLCKKFKTRGINYGFGGVAKLGYGDIPAEKIIMEHFRLGSTRAILSRSFCNYEKIDSIEKVESEFKTNLNLIHNFISDLEENATEEMLQANKQSVNCLIGKVVENNRRKQNG